MTKQRAEIGFSSALEELDPKEWEPKPEERREKKQVPRDDIRKVAKAAGFNSREASVAVEEAPAEAIRPARTGRIFQTGRNNQINLKVRTEDKESFYQICDQNKWVQGYTFQRALEALQRELEKEGEASQPGDRL